jgi:hypothetical protein
VAKSLLHACTHVVPRTNVDEVKSSARHLVTDCYTMTARQITSANRNHSLTTLGWTTDVHISRIFIECWKYFQSAI